MKDMNLFLTLRSDATFGRGDGVAGLVDEEVEYDPQTGLPYVHGRTLKGLIVEECANILFALGPQGKQFQKAAHDLFGKPGSTPADEGHLLVSSATLPADLSAAILADVQAERLTVTDVLESLTAIRRQTAVDEKTGAPEEGSLRSMRVVLRKTTFAANLTFGIEPSETAVALLTACVLSMRRAGSGRNRGRGCLDAYLVSEEFSRQKMNQFRELVAGGLS